LDNSYQGKFDPGHAIILAGVVVVAWLDAKTTVLGIPPTWFWASGRPDRGDQFAKTGSAPSDGRPNNTTRP